MSISSWYFCSLYDIQMVYNNDGIHRSMQAMLNSLLPFYTSLVTIS